MTQSFQKLLNTTEGLTLWSPPQLLAHLVQACQNPAAGNAELAGIIDKDAALSARVLALAAPQLVCDGVKRPSVERAVAMLGASRIKIIAVSSAVSALRGASQPSPDLLPVWRHALRCALVARGIAEALRYPDLEQAYMAGLLHDIGQLIILAVIPEKSEYAALLATMPDEALLIAKEQGYNGAAHYEIGSEFIRGWNLSPVLADAVLYHHGHVPGINNAQDLIKIAYAAAALCDAEGAALATAVQPLDSLFNGAPIEADKLLVHADQVVYAAAERFGITLPEERHGLPHASPETNTRHSAAPSMAATPGTHLAGVLGDAILLDSAHGFATAYASEAEILQHAQRCARILFGLHPTLFFFPDRSGHSLVSKPVEPTDETYAVTLSRNACVISEAAIEKRFTHSFNQGSRRTLTILDHQVIRAAGREGILCAPMQARGGVVGVMVLGADPAQLVRLVQQKQSQLLDNFCNAIATAVIAQRARADDEKLHDVQVRMDCQTQVRKVVHEASNPLAIIKSYVYTLSERLGDLTPGQRELAILSEEIDRVSAIIRTLDMPFEETEQAAEATNVNQIVSEVATLAKGSLAPPGHIRVTLQLAMNMPV
ncbi:MAG: HDOD domain-containing protein, partial [Burkholderiales bacterium]